jgi:hypothetical protein
MLGSPARMLFVVLSFASPVSSGPRAARSIAGSSPTPVIRFVWFDPNQVLPGKGGDVSREVAAIFGSLGFAVSWRTGRLGDEESLAADEVSVILLPSNPQGPAGRAGVMGRVQLGQELPHAAWIFVGEVKRVLRPPTLNHQGLADPREIPDLVGALARVVVHEIVHAVLPAEPHARRGLMMETLDRTALAGRRPTLTPACIRALSRALAGSRAEGGDDDAHGK